MIFQVFTLSIILGGSIGFLMGNITESKHAHKFIKELESDLDAAYREIDELHEFIHANQMKKRG